ncbi:hypothetical protein [Bradyrhizobium sp. 141]|uniref:hypothetical protein n=1 Tax=Bradyrhizobium sp. 141 TaxID=2782617 RepID=UPI001FF81BC4|nr:hypothetical protein [Bradyrhizobium sp. 141]MCK1717209.1 hypothetical protein [Bradyrhizobium sp. 141]
MSIFSNFSLQNVKTIYARTYEHLASAPLIITFQCDDTLDGGWSEISIHTDNKELSLALAAAINGAVEAVKAKQLEAEAA